jgi:hypothetical protein
VEGGVLGLVLWVATLGGMALMGWRARKVPGVGPYATATVALAIGFLAISAVDNVQGYSAVTAYLFVLAGAVAGAAYHRHGGGAQEVS